MRNRGKNIFLKLTGAFSSFLTGWLRRMERKEQPPLVFELEGLSMSEYCNPLQDGLPEHLSTHEDGRVIKTYPTFPENEALNLLAAKSDPEPSPITSSGGGPKEGPDFIKALRWPVLILVSWGIWRLAKWYISKER